VASRRTRVSDKQSGHMQVLILPSASRASSPLGTVGNAVHQHASLVVVSTMPQENVAPHCEQLLIFIPFSFLVLPVAKWRVEPVTVVTALQMRCIPLGFVVWARQQPNIRGISGKEPRNELAFAVKSRSSFFRTNPTQLDRYER
jgi:hypothetical protein